MNNALVDLLRVAPTAARYLEEYALTLKSESHARRVLKVSLELQAAVDVLTDTHDPIL